MNLPDIEEIRAEQAREGVGEAIYALLRHVVRSTATRYPPATYSSSETWDNGTLEELQQDWLAERLLRGDLEVMIASAASTQSLRRQLTTSLTQLIVNRRRRDSAGNLYRRTLKMLETSPTFVKIGSGAAQQAPWTLKARPTAEAGGARLEGLVRLAFELDDDELEVVRYGPHSLKSSPILRKPALERFLVHLLGGSDRALTPTLIAEVMQHRFSLVRERGVELEARFASDELVDMTVESKALAASAVDRLEPEEIARLRAIGDADWNFATAAEATSEKEAALRSTARRLAVLVAEYAVDEAQAGDIMGKVLESLFMEGNDE